jgi:hypothetical protein
MLQYVIFHMQYIAHIFHNILYMLLLIVNTIVYLYDQLLTKI